MSKTSGTSEHARVKRPPFARSTWAYWINGIFQRIAKDNNGRVADISMLAKMREEIETEPNFIDLDQLVQHYYGRFLRLNRQAIASKGIVQFVPGAALTVGKKVHVRMKQAIIPVDLLSWRNVEKEALDKHIAAAGKKFSWIDSRLDESAGNPDCRTLGDLEQKLHGYVPSSDDETSHLDIEGEDESTEH